MNIFYKAVFLFITCILFSYGAYASHIMGADITYTYMGTNASGQMRYFVRLSFYRDCCNQCLVAGPNDQLTVMDSCTGSTFSYTMNGDSCPNGCEVITLCPGVQSTCDNLNAQPAYPGVEKYIDTVTITLPSNCANWTVSWTDGARNMTITNLVNPNTQNIYIQATINNLINPATGGPYATNSVYFTKNPVPFACLASSGSFTYSNGAVAPLGDSLVYSLVNPLTAANTPIPHTTGYTATEPIMSNPPVSFNTATGILQCNPTQTEVDVITFLVKQYLNGVLVSSVMRDAQLTIINCALPPPPVDGTPVNLVNADTVQGVVKVCPGTATSFDIPFKDPNGRNVTLTSDINSTPSALPGGTFTQTGTGDSVLGHISWTPSPGDTGCHLFEINVATDDCPIPGTVIVSFSICVLTKVTVAPHSIIYCGTPIQLVATGGANATWTPTTGLTFPGSIYQPLAAPSATTLYTFTSDCGSDTALIIYNPPFSMDAGTGGTICQNNFIQLNATLDNLYAPYSILWIPATGLTNPVTNTPDDSILDPDASPAQTTTYTLQVTASTGCIRTDTVTVAVNGQAQPIIAHAKPDTICPGQQVKLWVTSDPSCGLATTPCQGNADIIQIGTGTSVQNGAGSVYPSPYGNFYKSARHQFLFHASELASLLGSGGQINAIAMEIGNNNGGSICNNFTIRIGCVPNDSLTGYVDESLLSTVYVSDYITVPGWNNHPLTTPYNWDGVSNLAVDVCFIDNTSSNINPKMEYTTTLYRSVWCTYSNDASGECGFSGRQEGIPPTYPSYFERPNFKFNFCIPTINNADITWTPNTGPNGVTIPHIDTTYSNPVSGTTYFVTLSDTNGCSSRSFVSVFVDTSVELSVAPDTFICSSKPVKINALVTPSTGSSVNVATIVYTWTTNPPGAVAPPSGTGPAFATPTVTATATTTYICTISGPGLCDITDSATIMLGTGLPIASTVDSITCTGNNGKVLITMNAGTAPYTYTWVNYPADHTDSLTGLGAGTYYLTVTDAGGCVGKDTFMLIAPAPLALSFDSSNIRCHGIDIDTITALVTGGRPPYRYTWSPVAGNTNTLTGLAAGTYNLTVTDTSGCMTPGTVHITQPSQIVSGAASTNLSGFNTDDGTITVTTTGGTGSYTYSSSPAVSGLPDATMLDTGRYIITVCDTNHCCVNDTAYISEPPPIDIVFTVTNNNCYGQCNGTASAAATGGVTPYTYAWTAVPASGVIGTGTTISQLCAGTYQISVTDANGLHVTKDTTISAPSLLAMAIDSTPITCAGANNGTLKDSVYGGTPPYTITWTPTGNGSTITGLAPGMYIADVTDANGCPAADTAYLGQPTPVTGTLISTDSVSCYNGSNGFANIQATGGRPAYSYSWSGSNSVDSFASNLAAGSGIVTIKDAAGCPATVPYTIYQPAPLVLVTLDTTAAHCLTSHDGMATATATGGTPPYTYAFDGVATAGVDSVTGLAPGIHTLEIMDSKGCVDTIGDIHFTIGTQYTLSINLQADSATCNGYSNGKAYATALNGTAPYTYQWSPSASTADSATDLAAGPESVIVTDVYGCTATGPVTIGQPNAIIDAVTATNPLCAGQATGKVAVSAGGTTGPYTYTFAGTVHPITDIITGLDSGTYYLTVTDGKGCTKADSAVLTDPLSLTLPAPAITGISCANEANGSIQLSPQGGTQPYTYSWTPGGYAAAGEDSLSPGTYTIIVTDNNGCQVSVTDTLSAPPLIYASFIVDSTSCPGAADGHIIVNAGGGTPGNPITYTYSLDGTAYQQGNNFFSLAAGMYQIYVKDSPGCVLDTFTNVYQPLAITAYINPQDSLIALGTSIQLSSLIGNVTTQSINSYAWSPATGLSCLDCPNPIASPYQATQYYLTVNYGKGCTVTDSALIGIGHGAPVYIPDAFTPNGDGTNDNFAVYGTTLYGVGMKIFDRWGEKVFDSGGSQWATWDGTYRGVVQSPGVFTYLIQLTFLDGSQETKQGSVTLIR